MKVTAQLLQPMGNVSSCCSVGESELAAAQRTLPSEGMGRSPPAGGPDLVAYEVPDNSVSTNLKNIACDRLLKEVGRLKAMFKVTQSPLLHGKAPPGNGQKPKNGPPKKGAHETAAGHAGGIRGVPFAIAHTPPTKL